MARIDTGTGELKGYVNVRVRIGQDRIGSIVDRLCEITRAPYKHEGDHTIVFYFLDRADADLFVATAQYLPGVMGVEF